MSAPTNESRRNPADLAMEALFAGSLTAFVEGQEARGGAQFVASETMPTDSPWDELVALGFVRGAPVEGDDLFVHATLPPGWSKAPDEDSRGSYVLDERGVRRVDIFYKAAFYDRCAMAHLIHPGKDLAMGVIYGENAVALPEKWDVLTAEEQLRFMEAVQSYLNGAQRHPRIFKDGARAAKLKLLVVAAQAAAKQ